MQARNERTSVRGAGVALAAAVLSVAALLRGADAPVTPVTPAEAPAAETETLSPADPLGPFEVQPPDVVKRAHNKFNAVNLASVEKSDLPAFSLLLLTVTAGMPADRAGLKPGDRLVKLNGRQLSSFHQVSGAPATRGKYTLTIWSATDGLKDYEFNGLMGVTFKDAWEPLQSYLQSKDRNPAWDKWMVVAGENWQDHPWYATVALNEARKAGYRGPLLPELRLCIALEGGHYEAALAAATRLPDYVAEADRGQVYQYLCLAEIEYGRVVDALALDRDHPNLGLNDHFWRPDLLVSRETSVTAAERALVNSGGLIQSVETDYAGKWTQAISEGADALTGLKPGEQAKLEATADAPVRYGLGPFCVNPAFLVSISMPRTADHGAAYGEAIVTVHDSATNVDLVTLKMTSSGYVGVVVPNFPQVMFNGEATMNRDGPNRIGFAICGPWCDVRVNDHSAGLYLIGWDPDRQLCPIVEIHNTTATVEKISYVNLRAPKSAGPAGLAGPAVAAAPRGPLAEPPPEPTNPTQRWFYQQWVGTYVKSGRRDAAWDADALAGLAMIAQIRANLPTAPDGFATWQRLNTAINHGCDDVLVRYSAAVIYNNLVDNKDPLPYRRALLALIDWLSQPGAPKLPMLEFEVNAGAFQVERWSPFAPVVQRSRTRFQRMADLIAPITQDKAIPTAPLRDALLTLVEQPLDRRLDRQDFFKPILDALQAAAPDSALTLTVRGSELLNYGQDARGNGWAADVADDAMQKFNERITEAAKDLKQAWQLDYNDGPAMVRLMQCGMGLGESDEAMDKYLKHALAADPDDVGAYDVRLWSLMPRWGGTHEAMQRLARQATQRYTAEPGKHSYLLALVPLHMHEDFAQDAALGKDTAEEQTQAMNAYWDGPGVWADVQACFELALKGNENNRVLQTRYMLYASKCHQWHEVERLLKAMNGEVCYTYFGGRDWFEYWLKMTEPTLRWMADDQKDHPAPPPPPPPGTDPDVF